MNILNSNKIANFSLLIGSLIIVFISSVLLTASLSFALKYPISSYPIFFAILTCLFFGWIGTKKYFRHEQPKKIFLILLLTVIIIFTICIYISSKFYDLSWDSQSYHQEGIIQLANGWKPFYDKDINSKVYIGSFIKTLLIEYTKGPWIYASALYKLTGRIEQSKAFNFLLIIASFFLSFSALLAFSKIRYIIALIISFLLSFNPVSIYQFLSFYIDGQLSSLLVSLASLAYLLFKRSDSLIRLVFALNIITIINVKLTGSVYAFIFIGGLFVSCLIAKKNATGWQILKVSLISLSLGVFFVGYSPYVTNTIRHGNPFYPVTGQRGIVVRASAVHKLEYFNRMNRFEKLFVSIFSKSENAMLQEVSRYKWPFTVDKSEIKVFMGPDTRFGGFGPLFSGAVILSLVIILIAISLNRKKTIIAVGLIFWILISAIVNSEAWWARFAPQIWLIPIISIILSQYIDSKKTRYIAHVLIFIMLINIALVGGSYVYWQYYYNCKLKQQLKNISSKELSSLLIFSYFRSSTRVRLNELGIKYREPTTDFATKEQLAAYIIKAQGGSLLDNSSSTKPPFRDVTKDMWSYKYIKKLYEKIGKIRILELGFFGDEMFSPKDYVTRLEMGMCIIAAKEGEISHNYCNSGSPFIDIPRTLPECGYLKRLYELNIFRGYEDGSYQLFDYATISDLKSFIRKAFSQDLSSTDLIQQIY